MSHTPLIQGSRHKVWGEVRKKCVRQGYRASPLHSDNRVVRCENGEKHHISSPTRQGAAFTVFRTEG